MREYIEKKLTLANIFLAVSIVLTASPVASMFYIEKHPDVAVWVLLGGLYACMIAWIVYACTSSRVKIFYKRLVKQGNDYIFDEMESKEPTFEKSKIVASHNGFVCKRNFAAFAYSDLVWIYQQQLNQGYVANKAVVVRIYCKDGKSFMIQADKEEFKQLLSDYILKYNPDVLVGYGKEQREQFLKKYEKVIKKENRTNRIAGICMICLGVAIFVASLFDSDGGELTAAAVSMTVCGILVLTRFFQRK